MFSPEQIEGLDEWGIFKNGTIVGLKEGAPEDVQERYQIVIGMLEDARKNGYHF